MKNELEQDASLSPAERGKLNAEMQKQAGSVNAIAADLAASSASEAEKARRRTTMARTLLVAADITRLELNDPKRVLELLAGFEEKVARTGGWTSDGEWGNVFAVQAYMELGRSDDGDENSGGISEDGRRSEGAQTVHDLLSNLNDELEKARDSSGDQKKVRQLAGDRAALSGFLVKWAQGSDDPKIHQYAYIYGRFDADSKRLAATLETDGAARRRDLTAAKSLYEQLRTPENFVLYQATLGPERQASRNDPDPLVSLGIGLIAYDLQDCQRVKSELGPLIQNEKLGDNNDQYWEATFKLLDCMHALAKAGDPQTTDAQVGAVVEDFIFDLAGSDGRAEVAWAV